MIELAEPTAQKTIKLPAEIAGRFKPADRFVVWAEGDVLYLKRVTPPSVTEVVAQASEGELMSLDEINKVVHQVRKQRRTE